MQTFVTRKQFYSAILLFLSGLGAPNGQASEVNTRGMLRDILDKAGYELLRPEPFEITKKYILGQALFFDPISSTKNDISCATCHLLSQGTSDGLKKSLVRVSKETNEIGALIGRSKTNARNSLALWNRDDNTVTNLFWDGRVEVLDPELREFRTPLKSLLPKSIDNALAAQSLFPLVSRSEMFSGFCNEGDSSCVDPAEKEGSPEWIQAVHSLILKKLIDEEGAVEINSTQEAYRHLFSSAYPNIPIENLDIGHVGNAIAHFEEVAFATRDARWDKFLKGNDEALSEEEIEGAILFFGKGRCAECHTGPVFSDYLFHTIGIINYKFDDLVDFGRYEVTEKEDDRFKFRTPSLRNVTLTAPYMHDGSRDSIRDSVRAHTRDCKADPKLTHYCNSLEFSTDISRTQVLSDSEVARILKFLGTLEDDVTSYIEFIIPRTVPSGLPINQI